MGRLMAPLLLISTSAQAGWQPDEFPIGFWYGPPPAQNKLESWQTIAEANFTFVGPCLRYTAEDNKRMLDLCRQAGIKAMVRDYRIGARIVEKPDWESIVDGVIGDYGNHPALYGYLLEDEPTYRWFEHFGRIHAEFHKRDPEHLPYINLYPTYASTTQLGTPTYTEYVRKYMQIVEPVVLSYDHYCLLNGGKDRPDYFENLAIIRKHALENDVPPWNIIQAQLEGYRDPTAAEIRWQVYTSLAYGMKGILYFTYWPRWDGEAIVDSEGKPTQRYFTVKQLNAEMKMLGKLLLSLKSTGVYHTGLIPLGGARAPSDLAVRVPQDRPLVIGCFEDPDGVEYVMLVNLHYKQDQRVPVRVKPHVVGVTEINARTGRERDRSLQEGAFTVRLSAGDGRLFRLKRRFSYNEPARPVSEIAFDFHTGSQGWLPQRSTTRSSIQDGVLSSRITGTDPSLIRPFLNVEPDRYSKLVVRMKLPKGKTGQIFWQTESEPSFGGKHLNFPTVGDGRFHEYTIEVGKHPKWRGQRIRALRLDPAVEKETIGEMVEIDYIRGE